MVEVISRQGANAIRAEEFALVEHPLENARGLLLVTDCEQTAATETHEPLIGRRDLLQHLRVARLEQLDELHDAGMMFEQLRLEHG